MMATIEDPHRSWAATLTTTHPRPSPRHHGNRSMTAGQALVSHVHRRSGERLQPDLAAVGSSAAAVRHDVPHLVEGEQGFGNLAGEHTGQDT